MEEIKEIHNFNNSGFNDDSLYSEETKPKNYRISNFLIKSQMTDSLNNVLKNNTTNSINETKKAKSSKNIDIYKDSDNDNNNIITSNTAENVKSSINSENEDNIQIIQIKNKNKDKDIINIDSNSNELSTNLLLTGDDNILFNFKNKLSKISSTDEIFRDTIKISMNRLNKFNKSKLARVFTYEESGKDKHYSLKSQKFGISKNKNVITYILNLYIFSEFINYNALEKDNRFKIYFIPISENKFTCNSTYVLNKLKINSDKSDQFISFSNGINELLKDKEYQDIQKDNKKFKINLFIITAFIFILICGIVFSFYYFLSFILDQAKLIKYIIISSSGIIVLLLFIILFFKIIKIFKSNLYVEYNNLNYMLINYSRFNDYIEDWNKNFFENLKIRVNIPISMKYLMFNVDPFQDIEIKHLDMKWFIDEAYQDKKSMINDKEFIKFYIKVRSTLADGNTVYE